MKPLPKELRPYQVRLVTDVSRAVGDVLIEQPTGSGKTMELVTLVAMHLGRRFTHAVIAAPQEQIEHGFVHRDYHAVKFPAAPGVAVPALEVPAELIWATRQSELGSVRRLLIYLRQPGPLDHALACTHAALNCLDPDRLPGDLSGKALFLDEAHHASADGLSQIVAVWRQRGGQLYFFTATPYRADGRPVALDGMRLFRRSLAEHMAEGFAPRHLESEIAALGRPGDAITAGQFTGEEAPPPSYFDELVTAICRKWVDDGRPKAIVRVPPMRGGSEGLVSRLLRALSAQGARPLDATGTGSRDKNRFLAAIKAEKSRSHAESAYDVMVGIQRVLEGTDWPVCSAVYCVGMPGSLNTVVQLLGRAMRRKGADYPDGQRDHARLVFFVPCAGGSALADLSLDHSRHALLTCCFLADHEIGQEWIVLREVRRGIEDALGPRVENPVAADAEIEADEALDPEIRAEVELAMASAREEIISKGGEPTLGKVVQLAAKSRPDLPEAALQRVAAEILASQPDSAGETAREAIRQEITKRLRIDPMVKKAMEEAFAIVLNEFREATLQDSPALESVRQQIHGVTGGQMREFAQRLREAAPRPLTEEQILTWADQHSERTGDWPVVASGPVHDAPGELWAKIDASLRVGNRGLAGGSSLPQLLERCRGARNPQALPQLTIEQILSWADWHHERTGQWPNRESGAIDGSPGEVWISINTALKMGQRGLPGGSSLAKLLAEHREVRNRGDLPPLTVDEILSWADNHRQRTGKWPSPDSGTVHGATGETWSRIHAALRVGLRGLPGGSSLAKFLALHRARRNQKDQPRLTEEQILAWADEHRARTGGWPKHKAGAVQGVAGETWSGINRFLIAGGRGLSGGSSLPKLLAEKRGARNKQDLPPHTIEQILAWADAHFSRTNQWPTQTSGPVVDAPGETWRGIHLALILGLRSLEGGSSIAKLLAEHRGVRNVQNVPRLTVDQVLEWADAHHERTGKWPTDRSGPVVEADGETWKAIDRALQAGVRGLPGGSSLARLLAQQRGKRNHMNLPLLTLEQILTWADEYHKRTGAWPNRKAGHVLGAPGERWENIDAALHQGHRGLPEGSSLAKLLAEERGVRNDAAPPPFNVNQILSWIDAHRKRTGEWPRVRSGAIGECPEETWQRVDKALVHGLRGLPGGSSLARLIQIHRTGQD